MKTLLIALLMCMAISSSAAEESPLKTFPYTPGLDVSAMDSSVSPCEDFYQYACGGWQKNNPIPNDQSSWDVYAKLYQDNQRFLWGILDTLSKTTAPRSVSQQKIGDYFSACMDEVAIEKRGITPVLPFLSDINALHARRELPALLGRLTANAPGSFYFDAGAAQDFSDSSQVIAMLSAGGLGLPDRDYYVNNDEKSVQLRAQYVSHVAAMLRLTGENGATAAAHAQRIMAIETKLAIASLTNVERRDPYKLFHRMNSQALQKLTPDFSWSAYWKAMQQPGLNTFNVTEPAFFRALAQLLHVAPLDDIKAYLRWHVISASAPTLSNALVETSFDFYGKTLAGTQQLPARWKRCVTRVDEQLGDALGQEFVQRTFGPRLKADTQRMTTQIEAAMEQEIRALDWMSEPTKLRALDKLHGIANKIGYPDSWRDYGSVAIKADDFYGNVLRASRFELNRQFAKIGKPVDHAEWQMTPPTVNAYYNPQLNDINFPAGILQPPLYDAQMDDAPNYGNTGGTIGHELTHAFDDEGRQFDANGNLRDWWNEKDAQEFKSRAQCVVDQYAQYTAIDDLKIKSELTQGEDIADLGGLVLAWVAWKAETKDKVLHDQDGLTPDQRFFVGNAQWACSNTRPETARLRALTDPHSPSRYRVNGLVVNMPEFEQAFNCKKGQPMVGAQRCRVW